MVDSLVGSRLVDSSIDDSAISSAGIPKDEGAVVRAILRCEMRIWMNAES